MTTAERPSIPAERYADRLARAVASTEHAGLEALLVGVGSDLRYLTGYAALPLERLTMLVIRPGRDPLIVVPRLERGAAEAGLRTDIVVRTWEETDDPYALVTDGLSDTARIAVSDTLIAMHLLRIQAALGSGIQLSLASARPARPAHDQGRR